MRWGLASVEEMLGSILEGRFMLPVKVPRGVVAITNSEALSGIFHCRDLLIEEKREGRECMNCVGELKTGKENSNFHPVHNTKTSKSEQFLLKYFRL